jgi:hypothetical protein
MIACRSRASVSSSRRATTTANHAAVLSPTLLLRLLLVLLVSSSPCSCSAEAPQLLEPADGAVIYCARSGATPNFVWDAGAVPRAVDVLPDVVIEISTQETFPADFTVTDQVPAILSRYVRAEPLELVPQALSAGYFWRVGVRAHAGGSLRYSKARSLELRLPTLQATVPAAEADWAAIQAAISKAAGAGEPYLLQFEPAARTLHPAAPNPDTQDGARSGGGGATPLAFIHMASATDVIIDGGGSTITFSDYVTFASLLNCTRVSIIQFNFDLDPLPYTALSVYEVHPETSTATLALLPGHPTLEQLLGNPQVEACCDDKSEVMTPIRPGVLSGLAATKRGFPEEMFIGNYTRVRAHAPEGSDFAAAPAAAAALRYKIQLHWGGMNPVLPHHVQGVEDLEKGDVIVVDPRIDVGFNIMGGEFTTLRSVKVFACSNECYTSQHAESLSILNCGTVVTPGRFLAANNGGHNHHSAAVGQWIEGGTWDSAGDDTVHVNGLRLGAKAGSPSSTELTLQGGPWDTYAEYPIFHHSLGVRTGDVLQFFQSGTGVLLAARRVLSMREATAADPTVGVVLDQPVGQGFNLSTTQIYSYNRTCGQFVFRKNTVRNGRRVGVLYKGFRAWVADNDFSGLGGGALELWNDPGGPEGLYAQTVLFRNNSVRDVCQLNRFAAPIWTKLFPDSLAPAQSHSDLVIEDSTFDTGPGAIWRLGDIASVLIRGNDVTHCSSSSPLNTTNTANVTFSPDNRLHASDAARVCVKTDDHDVTRISESVA